MSQYKSKNLFGSGNHGFVVHGAVERMAEHVGPGVDGVGLTGLGREGRRIDQSGTLLGDDMASMSRQLAAVEAELGRSGGVLVDELGRTWSDAVLVAFEPDAIGRVGVRFRVKYTARYVCVGG